MSVDITYHSFSSKRADEKWSRLQDVIAAEEGAEKKVKNLSHQEIRQFNEKKAKEFFDALEQKDVFIPWVGYFEENGTDEYGNGTKQEWPLEEKLSYVFSLGVLCPRGINPKNKEAVCFIITDFPDLQEKYEYILNGDLDSLSFQVKEEIKKELENKETTDLTPISEEAVRHFFDLDDDYNEEELMWAVQRKDIEFGSVDSDYIEDDRGSTLEDLGHCLKWKMIDDEVPSRDDLVALYQSMDSKKFSQIIECFTKGLAGEEKEYSKYFIEQYLRGLRPVAKDLKANSDAILLEENSSNSPDVSPQSLNVIINKRAKDKVAIVKILLTK